MPYVMYQYNLVSATGDKLPEAAIDLHLVCLIGTMMHMHKPTKTSRPHCQHAACAGQLRGCQASMLCTPATWAVVNKLPVYLTIKSATN